MKHLKAFFISMITFVIIGLVFYQCSKEKKLTNQDAVQEVKTAIKENPNPTPDQIGEIPLATVEIKKYESTAYLESKETFSYLTPEVLEATLAAEESIGELKTGYIEGAPAKGDIMFCFDLTGSMGGELSNAKVNSVNIMNGIRSIIPDSYFGVMSHMDYVGYFSGCGYSNIYGDAYYGDYPYSLEKEMVNIISESSTAINGLSLAGGSDGPENYTRPFYESYSDETIGWRSGSKKIMVAWLDNVPHDCAFDAIIGGSGTTGPDPGRDEIVGNEDDLEILEVLQGMADNNITLIVLYSGYSSDFALWQAYAAETGGTAVQINSNGTIPGGVDIAEFIANLISEEVSYIDEITLEVCTPGFEEWLTNVDPLSYTDISLEMPWTGDFNIIITVPAGTIDGLYEFEICLFGDGVLYGKQEVIITVLSTIEIPLDIHPTSCPNPINRKAKGRLPAAILGFEDFDVSQIDPTTLNIDGVYPIHWKIENVATPYYPFIGKELEKYSCNTDGPDLYPDLILKFENQAIAGLLSAYASGDIVRLEISGELYDGTSIIGEDIIMIVK